MLKNYIKTAWRNLLKNKFYSAINIAGLTAGLAIGILILLWVQDELSFDSFHKNAPNIYRVELWGGTGASRQIWTVGVAPIGPLAKRQLPEVRDAVRLTGNYDFSLFKYKDKVFGDEHATYADPSFFLIFDFHIVQGDAEKPFAADNSVVITRKAAEKYFGSDNPIGKVIIADNKENFTVTGVIDNFPKNSYFNYDMIMPMSYHIKLMLAHKQDLSDNFNFFSYETYVLLKPGTPLISLAKRITKIHLAHKAADTDADYLLLPLEKMHLYNADLTDKGMSTVRIFIVVALLILVIACINYVNLSTARSMLRSKEISMRKIVGAAKTHLFLQFIVETALLFLMAVVLALGLIFILMPAFNKLAGKELSLNISDYHVWMVMLLSITGTLAASSIYPALLLSSFEPLKALKGKISAGVGDVLFRKILVVTQFTFSVVLIIGTIVITSQLNYIRAKKLGYDKTNVFSFWMRDAAKHYDAVKAELLKSPGVLDVTRSNQNIVRFGGFTGDNDWDGKEPNTTFIVHCIVIDKDFTSFFKMKMAEGNTFTGAVSDTAHFVLNEAAIKQMGLKNPIGKRFMMEGIKGKIIGVVKDFHYASMKEKITPAVFWYQPQYFSTVYVKTTTKDAQKALAATGAQFKQYNGEYPFGYAFLDDVFNSLYQSEQREGSLFNYFASIAIFISCLGLLGLAAYTAQVRTREIGVRKVLGASVSRLVGLLAQDFIKLVMIAILIASPIAWFAMHSWLQAFAYRIDLSWWVFIVAGLLAVIIAFATMSFQTVKAALTNPVKSLRSE
ncbi:ABC transporter permease [Mucilaginibacter flavidus]|uniref:ABC transporter permease n=1 Tax=Mucilaginibacter flavidus TaxID=2949309 RepID=UPI002092C0A5|nr:ABC transporter permease [Mucilaginibacter flavidus]MCO5948671.1 ABC transporter permease [Mucilaginibacter flavidus]